MNLDEERISYGQYSFSFKVFLAAAPLAAPRVNNMKIMEKAHHSDTDVRPAKLKPRTGVSRKRACRIAHKLHESCMTCPTSLQTRTRQFFDNNADVTITKLLLTIANGQLCFRSAQASFDKTTCRI